MRPKRIDRFRIAILVVTIALLIFVQTGCGSSSSGGGTTIAKAPTANPGGPYNGLMGLALSFSGAKSSDPQSETLNYAWEFGDGATGTGVSPTHTYSATGTYNVSLTVTDTSNLSSSAATTATIQPQAPTANAGGPYTGTPGVAVSFNASASSDPQNEALTYAWEFGDGATGTGVSPTHIYTSVGTYNVSLSVTDTSNLSSTANTTATIALQPPIANAGGPYTGLPGNPVAFNGTGSSDPQNEALTYSWTFGDGSSGTGVKPSHSYAAAGNYVVSLTVTDTSNLTGSATTTATIDTTGSELSGDVYSGSAPVSGAHVYLMADNTTGYGQASISLLSASITGNSDQIGAYVLSSSDGSFTIPAGYPCAVGSQIYIYSLGGTIDSASNSAAGLLSLVGTCDASSTTIWVNEVTTVASAYSLSGFAVDATHVSSSGTVLALVGVTNAFANFTNLAKGSTGAALATTPAGNGKVSQATINTLANILNACLSSTGPASTECTALFGNALSGGSAGTSPTDTATAAINIAHNPGANIASLYALQSTAPPFTPALSGQPNDFTIGIQFTGGGIYAPTGIAIDAFGDVWVTNQLGHAGNGVFGSVTRLSSTGVLLSGEGGYIENGIVNPEGIAIDLSGNAWATNNVGDVVELTNSGSPLSGTCKTGTACGYTAPNITECGLAQIAIDASGNAWFPSHGYSSVVGICASVTELSSSGTILSGSNGYLSENLYQPYQIAIDGSGNAWVTESDNNTFTEFSNSGTVLSGTAGYQSDFYYPGGIVIDSAGNAWSPGLPFSTAPNLEKLSYEGAIVGDYTGGGLMTPYVSALDGSGNIWIANLNQDGTSSSVSEFSNAGVAITGPNGYTGPNEDQAAAIAVDGSGNVWIGNGSVLLDDTINAVTELIGAATPVITPIVAGLPSTPTPNGTSRLGTRP
jgi:PKD repeat protein